MGQVGLLVADGGELHPFASVEVAADYMPGPVTKRALAKR